MRARSVLSLSLLLVVALPLASAGLGWGLSSARPSALKLNSLQLRGGGDGAKVPKAEPESAKAQLQDILNTNKLLEEEVSNLQEGYDKLAKTSGIGSFRPTRTASYSCLNDAALTDGNATATLPTVEEINQKIAEKLAKDSKPLDDTVEELPPEERLNIVIVSSEIAPFSKSGGLADVSDKLGCALSRLGHRVMTVAPLYSRYEGAEHTGAWKEFGVCKQKLRTEYWRKWRETVPAVKGKPARGVDHVFVQQGCYERWGMYGHNDDLMRFALLSWAALEAPFCVNCPDSDPNGPVKEGEQSFFGDDVVFICNDWMVGLVPLIMTSHYRRFGCYQNARTVFDIHNMGYWGGFPPCDPHDLGLPDGAYFDMLHHDRQIKLLKGGIELADRVVTVSPSYRDEILSPEGGWGLQDACRRRFPHLDGVLNGIDIDEWNPATDNYLSANCQGFDNFFSADNVAGKAGCKAHLQASFHLPERADCPVIAFIGRLAYQKGIDILEAVMPWLMNGNDGVTGDVQVIMMGTGDERYARFLRDAQGNYHGRAASYVGFTPEMEHKILAGADILVMPSRYEPCGLPQLYAQRYGTVPVVHATGGLKDSVEQYDPFSDAGTGWKFDTADAAGLQYGLWNAINTYKHHKESWNKLVLRCMQQDFSWERSAKRYVEICKWAKIDPPYHQPIPF